MLEILSSGLVDDVVEMVSAEDGESAVEIMLVDDDDADIGVWLESGQHEDEEDEDNMDVNERYEDWLENELSMMMVDGEILEKVREKICVSCGRQCDILRRGCVYKRYTGKYC